MSVIFLLITKLKALGLESDSVSSGTTRTVSASHVVSPPATPKGKPTSGASDSEHSSSPTHEPIPSSLSPRSPRAEVDQPAAVGATAAAAAASAKPVAGKKPHSLTVGASNTALTAVPAKKRPMVPPRNKSLSGAPDSAVAGPNADNTTSTAAVIKISEPVPTDPEERKKFYVIRIQAAARGYLARRKFTKQIKEQKEVSALFKADPAALKKLIRLQATIRGMRTRNLPVLRARRKRNEIANEIFRTEDTYVNQLQVLVDVYMKGLEELGESVITAAKLRSIFSDVKVILGYNNVILKMLTERMKTWYASGQAVGDIFGKLADFLKTYTAYVNNYNESMNVLQDQMMNNPPFAAKINECRMNDRVKGMEITSFLIMPIQRLPRYVMLLSDLFKNTPESHVDYERLIVALKKVEGVASYVNTKKREAENLLGVTTVARHLAGLESMAEFTQPHRRYVRQGFLQEADAASISAKSLKTRYFFAFNDILVGTKESTGVLSRSKIPANGFDIDGLRDSDAQFKYLYRFPLLGALINELPEQNKVTNMFELVESPTPLVIQSASQQSASAASSGANNQGTNGSDSSNGAVSANGGTSSTATSAQAGSAPKKLVLVAPTPQLKDEWIHDLDEIVMTCLEKHRSRIGVTPAEERTTLPDNLRTPTFTGILHKRTEAGEWKKNYFVLCADVLMYYPNVQAGMNPESTVVPKKIPLILASVMSVPLMDRSYSMRLFTKERVYILSADTAHERMQWVNMIRAAIAKRLVEIEARQRAQNEAALQAHTAAHATQHTSLIGGSVAKSAESPSTTPAPSTKVSKRKDKDRDSGNASAAAAAANAEAKDAHALGIIAMVASGSSPAPTSSGTRESPRKRSESTTPASEKKSRKKDKEKTASIGKTGKAKTLSGATSAAVAAELKSQSPAPATSSDETHENGTHSEEGTAPSEGKNGKSPVSRSSSKKDKEEKEKKSTLRKKKKAAEEGGSDEQKIFKSSEIYKFSSGSEKVVKQKMTLQDGTLKLYKSSKSKAVQSINLLLVQPVSNHLETTTVKDITIHQFTLITPERKFVFGCDSEEEAQSWIETIQLAHEALGR